jgi:hypothetical protein
VPDNLGHGGDSDCPGRRNGPAPAATLLANIQASEAPHLISEALAASLHSRDLVNRACGILMQRHSLTVDVALAELMRRARRKNSTLGQISADLVAGIPAALG